MASGISCASSALSSASKKHRYLDEAINIVSTVNSHLFSAGEQYEVR